MIIFHCLTPHAALPNTSRQLRLSADFRWQQPGHPAPAEMILGPAGRSPELFGRLLGREPWWEPVPAGLALRPQAELAAQPPCPVTVVRSPSRLAALAIPARASALTQDTGAYASPPALPGRAPVNYPAAGSTQTIPICALVTALTKCRSSDRSAAVKRTMSMPCYGRAPAVRQPAWYPVRASAE